MMRLLQFAAFALTLLSVSNSIASAQVTMKYPGVYVQEIPSGLTVTPAISTDIAVFIGYTERAPAAPSPQMVTSFLEFETEFGGRSDKTYSIQSMASAGAPVADFVLDGQSYVLVEPDTSSASYLYDSVKLFFQNGGRHAYILPVGRFDEDVRLSDFEAALAIAGTLNSPHPTLISMPDALLLDPVDYYALTTAALAQSTQHNDRIVLIDVYDGDQNLSTSVIDDHRTGLGTQNLKYGASYYPFLNAANVKASDLSPANIAPGGVSLSEFIGEDLVMAGGRKLDDDARYKTIMKAVAEKMNTLPPGPAIAGVITQTDLNHGVWKAPANVNLSGVKGLTVSINDAQQAGLNVDAQTGKSINAIRAFTGRGNAMVWGARTLDGNGEYRYISVLRTALMIEEGVAQISAPMVFEPNDANTWAKVKMATENWLNQLWRQGALQGAKPSDAYGVHVGLGITMTAADIQNGLMRIHVNAALLRPAEFIVIRHDVQMTTP